MTKFSANLGFLWPELALPDAIRAAYRSGFDAVECHWPYETPAPEVLAALKETDLKMLSLNTVRGDVAEGENGLSALVDREACARAAIDQAIEYAVAIGALNIHVMAGISSGAKAYRCFIENLHYASSQALAHGIRILIEPLNHYDAPGYFLNSSKQAIEIIEEVDAPNLKLMFDCYHLQIMEGDITRKLTALFKIIGHIQIASVPDRLEPHVGELNYRHIIKTLEKLGYTSPIGAEYKPSSLTENGLDWMQVLSK